MKNYRTATAVMVALLIAASSTDASAQLIKNYKDTTTMLQQENEVLRSRIDSLMNAIEQYRQKSESDDATIAKMHKENKDREEAKAKSLEKVFTLGPDAKDSISLWDAQKKIASIKDEPTPMGLDSVRLNSSVADDIYLQRILDMENIFTLPYNDIVRNYVVLYAEKRKTWIPTTLGLCSYYFPIIQEAFNRHGIPEELACLAIVESAMNPRAVSRVGAKGMWQFMYATAKSYGLRINSYVDERYDPYKSADAAARYLKNAYDKFGDWSLALSSYNCGSGNTLRAIARNGGNSDYWGIYQYLPKETRGYVPAFVGALYVTKYYKEHGMDPKPCALPVKVDTFVINKRLHFVQVRDIVGVPIEDLRNLNPQYMYDMIPGGDEYVLRVPEQYVDEFIAKEDTLYKYKVDSLFNPVVIKQIESNAAPYAGQNKIVYKVKSGDTLSKIAAKYKVTINDLKKWNNLKTTNLKIGQNIAIYKGIPTNAAATASKPEAATSAKPAETAKPAEAAKPAEPAKKEEAVEQPAEAGAEGTEASVPGAEGEQQPAVAPESNGSEDEDDEEEIRDITRHPELDRAEKAAETEDAATAGEAKAEPKPEPIKEAGYTLYTVQKGDTMYSISKKYINLTAQEIMDYNKCTTDIHPGDVLKIPVK